MTDFFSKYEKVYDYVYTFTYNGETIFTNDCSIGKFNGVKSCNYNGITYYDVDFIKKENGYHLEEKTFADFSLVLFLIFILLMVWYLFISFAEILFGF